VVGDERQQTAVVHLDRDSARAESRSR